MAVVIPSMQTLLEAGVHFGHQVRRGYPKMRDYIFGAREGIHIINLEYSEKMLREAAEYVNGLGKTGKVILFVGTKKQAQPIIKEAAGKSGAPFISYRWVAGLLTNLNEVRKNINKLSDLKEKQAKGELSHYTKKEQLLIARKLEKFDLEYGGVVKMTELPDAVFLADAVGEKIALAECIREHIPVVAIADTNSNPQLIDFPIPGNDDATKSLKILIGTIGDAYAEGIKLSQGKKETPGEEKNGTETVPAEAVADSAIAEQVAEVEEEVEKKEVEELNREERVGDAEEK